MLEYEKDKHIEARQYQAIRNIITDDVQRPNIVNEILYSSKRILYFVYNDQETGGIALYGQAQEKCFVICNTGLHTCLKSIYYDQNSYNKRNYSDSYLLKIIFYITQSDQFNPRYQNRALRVMKITSQQIMDKLQERIEKYLDEIFQQQKQYTYKVQVQQILDQKQIHQSFENQFIKIIQQGQNNRQIFFKPLYSKQVRVQLDYGNDADSNNGSECDILVIFISRLYNAQTTQEYSSQEKHIINDVNVNDNNDDNGLNIKGTIKKYSKYSIIFKVILESIIVDDVEKNIGKLEIWYQNKENGKNVDKKERKSKSTEENARKIEQNMLWPLLPEDARTGFDLDDEQQQFQNYVVQRLISYLYIIEKQKKIESYDTKFILTLKNIVIEDSNKN